FARTTWPPLPPPTGLVRPCLRRTDGRTLPGLRLQKGKSSIPQWLGATVGPGSSQPFPHSHGSPLQTLGSGASSRSSFQSSSRFMSSPANSGWYRSSYDKSTSCRSSCAASRWLSTSIFRRLLQKADDLGADLIHDEVLAAVVGRRHGLRPEQIHGHVDLRLVGVVVGVQRQCELPGVSHPSPPGISGDTARTSRGVLHGPPAERSTSAVCGVAAVPPASSTSSGVPERCGRSSVAADLFPLGGDEALLVADELDELVPGPDATGMPYAGHVPARLGPQRDVRVRLGEPGRLAVEGVLELEHRSDLGLEAQQAVELRQLRVLLGSLRGLLRQGGELRGLGKLSRHVARLGPTMWLIGRIDRAVLVHVAHQTISFFPLRWLAPPLRSTWLAARWPRV